MEKLIKIEYNYATVAGENQMPSGGVIINLDHIVAVHKTVDTTRDPDVRDAPPIRIYEVRLSEGSSYFVREDKLPPYFLP
ncbi:hypothetical protein L1281_002096 [Neisseria sp. HSC-16F19]|nr:hypothetical protein [Neisseria sp. HSC-16F19]MCP2041496.1 hypothetical protein [Neisseria sp. HSC-16F19]